MQKTAIYLILIFSLSLSSCSKKLTSIQDLSAEQQTAAYKVMKDVSCGSDAEQVMDIYLKGVFLSMKYEARAMLAADKGGTIVNIGSVNSFLGFPTGSAYVTSKHGLIGLTSSVLAELGPKDIRVNLLCPSVVDTPMHRRLRGLVGDDLYDKGLLPTVHLQRAAQQEEIAKSMVFLCSDDSSYITGSTLLADGGLTLTL